MLLRDCLVMIGLGAFFIAIGFVAVGLGKREGKAYDNYLSRLEDAREFLTHWPERPELQGLKAGGWISVVIGALLIILGIAFLFSIQNG